MNFPPQRPRDDGRRPRRRFSLWSLLAPVGLVVLVVAIFNALGESCVVRECADDSKKTSTTATTAATTGTPSKRPRYRVRAGDTSQTIAAKFALTEEQFRACNPQIRDFYQLQVGQFVTVGEKQCRKDPEGA